MGRLLIASQVPSLVAEHGLYSAWASVVSAPGLWSAGSAAVVQGLSRSSACELLLDKGLNPGLLHCQEDFFLPLNHQGSPLEVYSS